MIMYNDRNQSPINVRQQFHFNIFSILYQQNNIYSSNYTFNNKKFYSLNISQNATYNYLSWAQNLDIFCSSDFWMTIWCLYKLYAHDDDIITNLPMKILLLLLALLAVVLSADCPHDLEVRCIDDINKAYPVCQKAAHEKGADVPVDLECLKYFASMEKDCWPCICWIAQQQKWKVIGC